ncbi:ion transport protein [Nitzschia inconspicua]|uniref:Ion transport protein n=1 Tax=Nitzschia inconspicua TaxID=303405 RepID=A0A9K3KUF7_9STRA|nr:ion transport protein [Nitzschia inconspicua]
MTSSHRPSAKSLPPVSMLPDAKKSESAYNSTTSSSSFTTAPASSLPPMMNGTITARQNHSDMPFDYEGDEVDRRGSRREEQQQQQQQQQQQPFSASHPTSSSTFSTSLQQRTQKPNYQCDVVHESSSTWPRSKRRSRSNDKSSSHHHHRNSLSLNNKQSYQDDSKIRQSSSDYNTLEKRSLYSGDDHIIEKYDDDMKFSTQQLQANTSPLPHGKFGDDKQKQESKQVPDEHNDHDRTDQVETSQDDKGAENAEDSALWRSRLFVGKLVNHEYVQIAVIVLILINAIMMGLATMDWVTDDPRVENIFFRIDQSFLCIFTLEVTMQLYYLGISLFRDAWLVFDLAIVVSSWSFEGLQIVRAFRIFRAFRLVTRIKPLRDLVLAIGAVLPRMYAIAALLLIIFYVFAVLFTELFSDLPLSENYFGTLDASLFTCMEMMTLEWSEIAREVIEYESWAWAPFTFFIMISGFIVYNLIVAVVVEAVAVTEQTVRALDGIEPNSPTAKVEEAEQRIDLLRYHIQDMMKTQEQIQSMLEIMASEMMDLETKRMKSEERETLLRTEINRRIEYQRKMETDPQIVSLDRSFALEREKRESQRQERMILRQEHGKEMMNSMESVSLEELQRSMDSDEFSSSVMRSRRYARRASNPSNTLRERGMGHDSNQSINGRSVSSMDERGNGEKGWKRFLAFHVQDA